jgi:hypothetical protein
MEGPGTESGPEPLIPLTNPGGPKTYGSYGSGSGTLRAYFPYPLRLLPAFTSAIEREGRKLSLYVFCAVLPKS